MGNAFFHLGFAKRAVEYHEQALTILREIDDKHGEGLTLVNLGIAYADLRHTQRAIECWQQATEIQEETGDLVSVAGTAYNLALLLFQEGRHAEALSHAEQAIQVFTKIGHAQYAQQAQRLVAQIQAA